MSKHTPGPWQIAPNCEDNERLEIVNEYEVLPNGVQRAHWIADCDLQEGVEENRANAEFIVRACNSHDALMESFQRIADAADKFMCGEATDPPGTMDFIRCVARAAIAKTEGR